MISFARSTLPVLNVLGYVVIIFSATMLVPLGFAFGAGDESLHDYDFALLATVVSGVVLVVATRGGKRELQPRDGFLLVTLVWTVLPGFASLPLYFHIPGISFTDAYFEAMSGLTATGATVLSGLDNLPTSINVWRTFLQWVGGMGILVLAVAILPLLGVGGAQVFRAEFPGPLKETKLTPRISDTAKALYTIYFTLSVACFFAYRWAGMSWADAFMHMCSTMGLGGFSSHDASFAHWNSPTIEAVAVVFMLLAGVNFSLHFVALRRRSPISYLRDPEFRAYVFALAAASAVISGYLVSHGVYPDTGTAVRHAVFNTVSVATTTGYASTDYWLWPVFAPVLLLFLGGFTACAGSTGGGIKMIRGLILLKQARREMTRILHPRSINPVIVGREVIHNNVIFAILAFMLVYGAATIWLTFLMLLTGLDVVTAFSAIVACINNIGPGLNEVGPTSNYGGFTPLQTWVCTFAMLIGRLELFTVLVLLTPGYWRK